ncbi:class I histocompatibility antigen, F10 alpha chain-like isoform X2 [Sardina pilchardus]|uniref:class I histocompatibility antigen, F10 alpha chain-like isoform X2 n=1 Tax=Sardina pilchardus TaxID=27697 RepID=UPI002E1049E5
MGFVTKLALFFTCLPISTVESNVLQYFYTATSGVSNISKIVSVEKLNGMDMDFFESLLQRYGPRQTWMDPVDQEYWHSKTMEHFVTVMESFNVTGGVHTIQRMCGCMWDDETGITDCYDQYNYDGQVVLRLTKRQMRWTACVAETVPTMNKWNNNSADLARLERFLTHECTDRLKKYVQYGDRVLWRKVTPDVSVYLSNSSSAVCHATGFYPEAVNITWKRDGAEMQEDVDVGETLPNEDETFQKRVVLTVSPEERKKFKFTCEVAHQSGEPISRTLAEVNALLGVVVTIVCVWRKKKDH